VLLFEFFPLFVAVVGAIVCVRLVIADRRARRNPTPGDGLRRVKPSRTPGSREDERGSPRPSMR
jgi:hypothetical protein